MIMVVIVITFQGFKILSHRFYEQLCSVLACASVTLSGLPGFQSEGRLLTAIMTI